LTEVISVRFRGGCKTYDFSPGEMKVRMGEDVIVETSSGPEFATCTEGNHEIEDSAVIQPLSSVIRKATAADQRTVEYNRKRESEAFDVCEQKIADHGLEMKLVNVSASFDGGKITFFFTADGRVDFRELVRDLAGVFRARIELRQIGVRDEAKMVGGLGICGRPFCCSQFLDSFMPVSIKMAKTQNLSLNPTKISGTCGRLMCCLKYEQNAYEDAVHRMPKQESFVQTPDGPGNVRSVDLLRETVKVSLDSDPDAQKTYRNCEICVLRNGKGSREGIEIPEERPARYVEETSEEELFTPVLSVPFYMDEELEDSVVREKMSEESGSDGKPRRRRRGGRRRSGSKGEAASLTAKQETAEKAGTNRDETGKRSGSGRKTRKKNPASKKTEEENRAQPAEKSAGSGEKSRRPRRRGGRRHKNTGGASAGEGAST